MAEIVCVNVPSLKEILLESDYSVNDLLIGLDSINGLIKVINREYCGFYNMDKVILGNFDGKRGPSYHYLSETMPDTLRDYDNDTISFIVDRAISLSSLKDEFLIKRYYDKKGRPHFFASYYFEAMDNSARGKKMPFAVIAELLDNDESQSKIFKTMKGLSEAYFPLVTFYVEVDSILNDLKEDENVNREQTTDDMKIVTNSLSGIWGVESLNEYWIKSSS